MQFRVLGALEVVADGAVAELGPPKQRALLASLLLHVGEIVPVDRLIEFLWGEEPPRTASHSIQTYVSDLRRALEPLGGGELILTRQPGYMLDAERDAIDAWQFERLVRDGERLLEAGDPEGGRSALREALALWRGPALADFAYEEFAQPYIRRLNEGHLDAIELLVAAELEAGRSSAVVHLLEVAIREDPLRERSRELLMLALYRSGRHADALRTFDALRTQLADELGVDPSPSIRGLYDRILLHDPSLLAPVEAIADGAGVRNPYKGLRAFTETDAPDFFGRDDLIQQLLGALRGGRHLVSLVGPSGSGKSSVVAAGLVPRVRAGALPGSERWHVARMTPGPNPLREAAAVVARARGEADRTGADQGDLAALGAGNGTLLVVDQFEEVFSVAEDVRREEFLDAIARAVTAPDARLRVVLTLRADFYDRPLLHPEFAAVFGPSVVNALPMNARDLEAVIVEPARAVDVDVEPALLAELVAETADRPGSLPLLQYALAELFDRRTGPALTRAGYAALGGLRGLLSRRAEGLYLGLSAEAQHAATQVFLRLVRPGAGAAESRRGVALAELTDLGIDPVVLSEVLDAFGRGRLLTFDRDPASGRATVEVAHEALLTEWERLAGWIDRHRAALRRHGALMAAADEWEISGRNPDYLLAGSRLEEFEPWLAGGVLTLSGRERAFLGAAVERRRAAEADGAARAAAQHRAERRTRWRFAALGRVVVLLGAGLTAAVVAGLGARPPVVALVGFGEGVVWEVVESGFDRAVSDFGLVGLKVETHGDQGALDEPALLWELRRVSAEAPALIVTFDILDTIDAVAREFPDVHYVAFNAYGDTPNVWYVQFRVQQGAFLAGAAAALASQTKRIGVIGGAELPHIWSFVAGYEAGAHAVDPGILVMRTYLDPVGGDLTGFNDPAAGESAARVMYERGADVVFNVAGTSGLGIFEAAADMSDELGIQLWAIGVDSDQYESAAHLPGVTRAAAWRPHILTSMLKRFDDVVYAAIGEVAAGRSPAGMPILDLASEHLGLATSGGFIDRFASRLDGYRQQIIDGEIAVPCLPEDRLFLVEAFAAEQGMALEDVLAFICP